MIKLLYYSLTTANVIKINGPRKRNMTSNKTINLANPVASSLHTVVKHPIRDRLPRHWDQILRYVSLH